MITYVGSSLFTSPAHVLVNTVNTVGVMGKGIAKDFKDIFPEMFAIYQQRCESGELTIGKLLLYKTPNKTILNFPTKRHWRQKSRLDDIEAGLKTFVARYAELSLTSVAFPQLGCGNGGLDWESEVRPLMERYLAPLPIDIYIHVRTKDATAPEHFDHERMKEWLRSEPRSLGFSEVWDDLKRIVVTASKDGESFDGWQVAIEHSVADEAIVFADEHMRVVVPKDDLLDTWQQLREFGLLGDRDLSLSIRRASRPLFDLFRHLDYIDSAVFAPLTRLKADGEETTSRLLTDEKALGIRLVPTAFPLDSIDQLSLFEQHRVA